MRLPGARVLFGKLTFTEQLFTHLSSSQGLGFQRKPGITSAQTRAAGEAAGGAPGTTTEGCPPADPGPPRCHLPCPQCNPSPPHSETRQGPHLLPRVDAAHSSSNFPRDCAPSPTHKRCALNSRSRLHIRGHVWYNSPQTLGQSAVSGTH